MLRPVHLKKRQLCFPTVKRLEAREVGVLTVSPVRLQSCLAENTASLRSIPVLLTRSNWGGSSHGRKHRQEGEKVVHLVEDRILSSRMEQVI